MSRNRFGAIWQAWHLVTAAGTHKTRAASTKFNLFLNISFTSSDQSAVHKENSEWMKHDPMEMVPKI
jgi:hypothetical protein